MSGQHHHKALFSHVSHTLPLPWLSFAPHRAHHVLVDQMMWKAGGSGRLKRRAPWLLARWRQKCEVAHPWDDATFA